MAVSSENAKLDPHPRDAGVEARRSESFLFFSLAAAPLGENGESGKALSPLSGRLGLPPPSVVRPRFSFRWWYAE